jgi:hypothetical protein
MISWRPPPPVDKYKDLRHFSWYPGHYANVFPSSSCYFRAGLTNFIPQEGHIIRYVLAGGPHVWVHVSKSGGGLNLLEGRYLQSIRFTKSTVD